VNNENQYEVITETILVDMTKKEEIWKQVKRMEEVFNEHEKVNDDYHTARATMLANFGEKGSIRKGLINSNQTLTQMIVEALGCLVEKVNQYEGVIIKKEETKRLIKL